MKRERENLRKENPCLIALKRETGTLYWIVFFDSGIARRNASVTLVAKISSAPHQPIRVSAGSATSSGPSRAARRIRLDEMIEPSTAVTYRKPKVIRYCPMMPAA